MNMTVKKLLRLTAVAMFLSGSILPVAAQVYSQSRSGNSTTGANNPDWAFSGFATNISANKSTAPGLPAGSSSSRFAATPANNTVSFTVSPNNTTANQLQVGSSYNVLVTFHKVTTAGQQESSDIIVTTSDTQCTGNDTFARTNTAFQNGASGANGDTWIGIGTVTVSGSLPTFTFTWSSGTNINRWYADAVQFAPAAVNQPQQFWNTGSPGGTGAWDAFTANWNSLPDGTGAQNVYAQSQLAGFNGTAGTVSIDPGGVTTDGGVEFDTGGYIVNSGPLTLGTVPDINVVGPANTATINSVLLGNNGMGVGGTGTLILNNSNNLTGSVLITYGTLSLGTNVSFGTITSFPMAILQLNTNTLTVGDSSTGQGFTGTITDAGAATPGNLIKQGSGTQGLSGTNTFHGTTTVNAGALTLFLDAALGSVPASTFTNEVILTNGGRLDFGAVFTLNAKRGIFLGAGGGLLSTPGTGTTPTISGPISGSGSLTIPSGAFDLKSTSNTFSGGLYITATQVDSGGNNLCSVRFDAQGSSGTGKIFMSPTTTVNCTLRNFNTAGTIIVPNDLQLDRSPSQVNTQIYLSGGASSTNLFAITFSGNINGAAPVNIGLDTAGGSSNPGGQVNLSGSNSLWTGGATLQAGTLGLGSSNALGTGGLFLVPQGPVGMLLATTPLTGASAPTNSVGINTSVSSLTIGGTNNLELAGPVFLYASSTINVTNSGSTLLSGSIGDSTPASGFSLTTAGTSTLTLTGSNTYDGGTFVTAGTLKVNNTTGSGTGTGPVTVSSGATLGGNGTISGTVDLSGTLSPGSSPGKLTTADQTWEGGASYTWEINLAGGTAGANPGWDQASITGGLNINASSGSPFTINITSLTSSNTPGPVSDFNNTHSYTWSIAHTTTGITNFSASAFILNTNGFANSIGGGTFGITNNATDILLTFTSPISAPTISSIHLAGTNLTINGTGGAPNGTYRVLMSTNITNHLATWGQIGSGSYDNSGNFSFSGSPTPGDKQEFYVIASP